MRKGKRRRSLSDAVRVWLFWPAVLALLVHGTFGGCTCPHHLDHVSSSHEAMPSAKTGRVLSAVKSGATAHLAAHHRSPEQAPAPAAPCCGSALCAGCCAPAGPAMIVLLLLVFSIVGEGHTVPRQRIFSIPSAVCIARHPRVPRAPPA
ncbi:MAG: hypothetical protein D6757_01315 [Alphaproteobacteria bacterium]|nr:MAG: hypothetical protein D6757_01315 [Alphaproteobacteria bacterium]